MTRAASRDEAEDRQEMRSTPPQHEEMPDPMAMRVLLVEEIEQHADGIDDAARQKPLETLGADRSRERLERHDADPPHEEIDRERGDARAPRDEDLLQDAHGRQ